MTQLSVGQDTDKCEICGGKLDASLISTGRHLMCGRKIRYGVTCQEETCGKKLVKASTGRRGRFCDDTCSKRHRRRQKAQKAAHARLDDLEPGGSVTSGRDAGALTDATAACGGLPGSEGTPSESVLPPSEAVFPQVSEFPDTDPSRYYANNFSPILAKEVLHKPLTREKTASDDRQEPDTRVRQTRRRDRFRQREILWQISSLERVRKCGKVVNSEGGLVALVMKEKIAHWRGYCSCASIWICPVCSAKIRLVRANDIAMAVAMHIMIKGGTAWMVTLTARHKKHDDLAALFSAVSKGWTQLMSGKDWAGKPERISEKTGKILAGVEGEKERLGVTGWIRSLEVTYGKNGFHPHLHVVLLLEPNEDPQQHVCNLARAMGRWKSVWHKWMAKHGYEPSDQHGIVWSAVHSGDQAGQYIAKTQDGSGIGNEMARGDLKKGRHGTLAMFELLAYFDRTGDADVIEIWHEYEKGTHRRRAITWSGGLRALYLEHKELTEEEASAEVVGGETLVSLPAVSRKAMQKIRGLQSDLLDAAENEGFDGLVRLLLKHQLEFEIHDREDA